MDQITLTNIQVDADQGLQHTLQQMYLLESLSYNFPSFIKFVFDTFHWDCPKCQPSKIHQYITENFKYELDDPYDEKITAPYLLLQTKKGDCDDFSLFAKTCLDILTDWKTNYLLLSKDGKGYSHVVCLAHKGIADGEYIEPTIIDGANPSFNIISTDYKFYKII